MIVLLNVDSRNPENGNGDLIKKFENGFIIDTINNNLILLI